MYITRAGKIYPHSYYVRKNKTPKYFKLRDKYEFVSHYQPKNKRTIKLRRIQEIVLRHLKGETCQSIANDYGITRQGVSDIILRYNQAFSRKPHIKLRERKLKDGEQCTI